MTGDAASDAAPDAEAAPVDQPRRAPRGSETVLVAEDEEGVRALVGLCLEGLGYTVLLAESGAVALRLAAAHPGPVHLLLTDVVLPDTHGQALADAVRARRPGTAVLFMSGYSAGQALPTRAAGAAAGAEAFLGKPFTPRSLAGKVREVLDAAAGVGVVAV